MVGQERMLIEAIESGDLNLVKRLLLEGTDPNARKKVSLVCDIRSGRRSLGKFKVRSSLLLGDEYEERWENTFESSTDTRVAESALCLSILLGRADMVDALLEAGADPNAAIEWPNANGSATWSPDRWNDTRWLRTYQADSPLFLAIGRGVTVTDYDGISSPWASLADNGKLRVNHLGAEVQLHSPESWNATCRDVEINPQPEIVRVLLRYGAKVTPDVLEAVKRANNRVITDILEQYKMEQTTDTQLGSSNLWRKSSGRNTVSNSVELSRTSGDSSTETMGMGNVALSRLLVEQIRQNEDLRRDIRNMQAMMAERAAHFADLGYRAIQFKSGMRSSSESWHV
ncbi:hypothetical protein HDU93_005406 [Gonapodya sp. JEL0774]|nr:hypothetical protein HDU93_005406 [Gonapodya sp. JEL0774]